MKKYYYKSLITGFFGVCAEKGFFDGFINQCVKDRIPVRKIKAYGDKHFFCVPCEFYGRTHENAILSGVEIKITGSFGLLPFVKKYKHRAVLFFGVIFSILFISLMSFRVWSIKVTGNKNVFSSEILSVCEELGLKTGVKKKKIDVNAFQKELLDKTDGRLVWASLNIEGMCAEIEVRETVKYEDDTIGKPCNYIADFDGVIKIIRVYSGTPEVKRGSGVKKGDLLISGVTEYETGESSFTEAGGKITAEHTVKIKKDPQKKLRAEKYTDIKKCFSVSFFGLEIKPLSLYKKDKNAEITKCTNYLEINDTVLPFSVNEYILTKRENGNVENEKLIKLLNLEDYLSSVRAKFKNSKVISCSEKFSGGYSGIFDCIDRIGMKSPITVKYRKK